MLYPSQIAQHIDPTYEIAPHIKLMERFILGQFREPHRTSSIINCAVGHGKSLFSDCYLPLFLLSANPDCEIILATYSSDFSEEWGSKARDLWDEFAPELFGLELDPKLRRAGHWGVKHHKGCMRSVGCQGKITGKRADYEIFDDLFSTQQEAESLACRNNVWNWFFSDALTRCKGDSKRLLIQSIRHPDECCARLKALEKQGGDKWEVLRLPALAEADDPLGRAEGEPLWPSHYTKDVLNQIKNNNYAAGLPHIWDCLYQNDPRGNPASYEWTNEMFEDIFYDKLPEITPRFRIVGCDPSFGGVCFGSILYVVMDTNRHLWVEDATIKHMPMTEIEKQIVIMMERHRPTSVIVEGNGSGSKVAQNVILACQHKGLYCPMNTIVQNQLHGEKLERIRSQLTPLLAQHRIHIKKSVDRLLFAQMRNFPSKPLDAVDSLSLICQQINHLLNAK